MFAKINSVTSTLSLSQFEQCVAKYHLEKFLPVLPGKDDTAGNPLSSNIAIYTKSLEVAGLRLPLSDFLKEVLSYYGIHVTLMSPQGICKILAFEVINRCLDQTSSLNLFRRFFRVGTVTGGWYTIERRPKEAEIIITRDSLKKWHVQFLYVSKRLVCEGNKSLAVWRSKKDVLKKNSIPERGEYDIFLYRYISKSVRVDIRKGFPEPMLVHCGISRIWEDPGKIPVPYVHGESELYLYICTYFIFLCLMLHY